MVGERAFLLGGDLVSGTEGEAGWMEGKGIQAYGPWMVPGAGYDGTIGRARAN